MAINNVDTLAETLSSLKSTQDSQSENFNTDEETALYI